MAEEDVAKSLENPGHADPYTQKAKSQHQGSGSEGGYPDGPEVTEIPADAGAGS
jgi:hypothetical protein